MVADRYGERVALSAGLLAAAGAMAGAAAVPGVRALGALLVLAGAAGSSVNSASGRLVIGWFPPGRRGVATGVRQASQPLGTALAAAVLPPVAHHLGLSAAFGFCAALCGAAGVTIVLFATDPPRPERAAGERTPGPYRGGGYLWRLHGVAAVLCVPQFVVTGFSLLFLTEVRGWSAATAATAGTVLAVANLAGAGVRLLAGWWSDTLASRVRPMRLYPPTSARPYGTTRTDPNDPDPGTSTPVALNGGGRPWGADGAGARVGGSRRGRSRGGPTRAGDQLRQRHPACLGGARVGDLAAVHRTGGGHRRRVAVGPPAGRRRRTANAANPSKPTAPRPTRLLLDYANPHTATHHRVTLNTLAQALQNACAFSAARLLHQRVLDIETRTLGPDHPDTLTTRNDLACALDGTGNHTEAVGLLRHTLNARAHVLGPAHPHTLASRESLALALDGTGEHIQAVRLHRQTLDDRTQVLGNEHPHTLHTRNALEATALAISAQRPQNRWWRRMGRVVRNR